MVQSSKAENPDKHKDVMQLIEDVSTLQRPALPFALSHAACTQACPPLVPSDIACNLCPLSAWPQMALRPWLRSLRSAAPTSPPWWWTA